MDLLPLHGKHPEVTNPYIITLYAGITGKASLIIIQMFIDNYMLGIEAESGGDLDDDEVPAPVPGTLGT